MPESVTPEIDSEILGYLQDIENQISDDLLAGNIQHERMQALLAELEEPSEQQRIEASIKTMVDRWGGESSMTMQEAIIRYLAELRQERGIELASLQVHAVGCYREMIKASTIPLTDPLELDEARQLPMTALHQHIYPPKCEFGHLSMNSIQYCWGHQREQILSIFKRLKKQESDEQWEDSTGSVQLTRSYTKQLTGLNDAESKIKRKELLRDRIRSHFYKDVFVRYFDPDELDPRDINEFPHVLAWLLNMEEFPHLYPYMQGQSPEQKCFRIKKLIEKLIQVNELYQRLDCSILDGTIQDDEKPENIRQSFALLAQRKAKPLKITHDFIISTFLFPFPEFCKWVQELVKTNDFVLPPDPR